MAEKDEAAVTLGRRGGAKRRELPAAQRSSLAREAANRRWGTVREMQEQIEALEKKLKRAKAALKKAKAPTSPQAPSVGDVVVAGD